MVRIASLFVAAGLWAVAASPAAAWGDVGHKVTALLAYRHLTPVAKAKVDALLAADTDTLTAPDFASRATWADKYRAQHRETAQWHFADIEIDQPGLDAACYGYPKLAAGQVASAGQPKDCSVDKIGEFEAELSSRDVSADEQILALKFLVHFLGDLHQPLHSSDHQDEGGNCIALEPTVGGSKNLHGYWDTGVMKALAETPEAIADKLDAETTAGQRASWSKGTPKQWAMQAFALAQKDAYAVPSRPTCAAKGSVSLSDAYQAQAQKDVDLQLRRAGVRIAAALNQALR
ncbi:S1/P1 nuclease [Caulobacter sp. KR2-114]|uniref:S1/P1 nuclease n=1 Tax=Caulobacter sp. KR2-114 TaxID=3400912 RepID=UPI003C072F2E